MSRISTYVKEVSLQTRATCIQSIKRLKEERTILLSACGYKMAELDTRIKDCQLTIDSIDDRLKEVNHA